MLRNMRCSFIINEKLGLKANLLSSRQATNPNKLRTIVIDGPNVAFEHSIALGRGRRFSSHGLIICVDYFKKRGHKVKVVVPQKYGTWSNIVDDRHLLEKLKQAGTLSYAPHETYDDRFVLQYANRCRAIVVSNDGYRDIKYENPGFLETVQRRKLGFMWIEDDFMVPQDPKGPNGPTLDEFLQLQ